MNNLAKVSITTGGLMAVLSYVPSQYAIYPAGLIILCVVLRAVIQPPAADSRWAGVYQIMSALAGCIGWALPRLRPGISAIDVPRGHTGAGKAALASAGVPVVGGKPDT
ncbi:hypothetical protein AA103196_2252 [Ameyamaea chiangmaiensis NBRC 103196]|uniref:Uncharacterized protein n=1 Tax=Ameyamaea chiangmaiensis TaxID=442969 RepID=A0A850P8T6_9PROT|nr:hypothetical protein [Ameyamaea chiangmaiensis]MBS4075488.1 hypothetical protein [Ameyamaea chiangmaiensis]NVN38980.1 hypothetical protein [Ameyamaea chiangmaiensis]GBQ69579.1 hypothetical protein AA103196_2252 [Ameyamaea chiangmaiensis NBRC 103196]